MFVAKVLSFAVSDEELEFNESQILFVILRHGC